MNLKEHKKMQKVIKKCKTFLKSTANHKKGKINSKYTKEQRGKNYQQL